MKKDGSALKPNLGNPLWLVAELTYRCPLQCVWCSNPVEYENFQQELTTEEWKRVLREARKLGALQLGFSGGEPLVRKDLEDLIIEARKLGYYSNLITSGIGMTKKRLQTLKALGLDQVQLSIQSSNSQTNKQLVGVNAFEKKCAIAHEIKAIGFPMVLNVPISKQNIGEIKEILIMAEELQADYLELANVQYYNWALVNRDQLLPTQTELQEAEAIVNETRQRIGDKMKIYFVVPDYYEKRPKPCMNGWGSMHMTVAPNGEVLPCLSARVIKGLTFPTVKEQSLDWIWQESKVFNEFRGESWMKSPCQTCLERKKDFGGCRCQAYMLTGNARNADPVCDLSPHHSIIETAIKKAKKTNLTSECSLLYRKSQSIPEASKIEESLLKSNWSSNKSHKPPSLT